MGDAAADQEGAADAAMNGQAQDQQDQQQAGNDVDGSSILKGLRFQPPEAFDGTDSKFEFFSMKLRS